VSDAPPDPPAAAPAAEPPATPVEPAHAVAPTEQQPRWRRELRRLAIELRDVCAEFFLSPTTGEAGAAFRIVFGLLALYYLCGSVYWNLDRYYGNTGVLPHSDWLNTDASRLTLLGLSPSPTLLYAVFFVTVGAAALFTLGASTRVMAAISYVGLTSFYNRNPWLMNAGDHLVVILMFLCIVAPVSVRWSVDSWWRARRAARRGESSPKPTPVYGLAIIRLLICFVYLSSFVHKMSNSSWRSGEAVSRILDSTRFAAFGGGFDDFPLLERLMTWGTLLIEGLFLLVLMKKYRPWVLAAGVGLHVGIEVLMKIPMFTAVMLVSYVALLDDSEVRWITGLLRRRQADAPAPVTASATPASASAPTAASPASGPPLPEPPSVPTPSAPQGPAAPSGA
jgi:hypothetical protein